MKKYLFYFSFLAISGSVFQSCKNTSDNPDKVQLLDSLLKTITNVEKELSALDSSAILSKANKMDEIYSLLNENKPDTVTKETGFIIETFNNRKKVFDTYRAKKALFFEQMSRTKKQLHDLSHDLDKNLIEDDKMGTFFATETKRANELIESAQITIKSMNESLSGFDSANVAVQDLVFKLKAVNDSVALSIK